MSYPNKTVATSSNQSTVKALAIIELLARNKAPMRLTDLAAALDMNSSTASRFLSALQGAGYVEKNKASLYRLTYKICYIANMVDSMQLHEITHPYLLEVSRYFGESTCISVEQNMVMVYVDVITGPSKTLMSMQSVGHSSPMHCTGNGKVALLEFSDDKLRQYMEEVGLKQYTPHTITTERALRSELENISRSGYALDDEESELGVRCVACPLRNYTGKIIAGISVTGPTTRMSYDFIRENLPYLQSVAASISRELGYHPEEGSGNPLEF